MKNSIIFHFQDSIEQSLISFDNKEQQSYKVFVFQRFNKGIDKF